MKKKKKVVAIIVFLVICIFILFILLPLISPVTIKGNEYEYQVFFDYVKLIKYTSDEENVILPEYIMGRPVKEIGADCFHGNNDIIRADISNTVELIDNNAFYWCENLEQVYLGKNTKQIQSAAFSDCEKLQVVEFNEKLEEIGMQSFLGCTNLEKINIPDSVKVIDDLAFAFCGIKEISIPDTVSSIGDRAFKNTPWLDDQAGFLIYGDQILIKYNGNDKDIMVPYGVKALSASFYDYEDIKNVYIPDSVTYIGGSTFANCKDVTVYIPENVTEIGTDFDIISDVNNMTIVTISGSYAEQYAKEQGIKCEIVDQIEYPTE